MPATVTSTITQAEWDKTTPKQQARLWTSRVNTRVIAHGTTTSPLVEARKKLILEKISLKVKELLRNDIVAKSHEKYPFELHANIKDTVNEFLTGQHENLSNFSCENANTLVERASTFVAQCSECEVIKSINPCFPLLSKTTVTTHYIGYYSHLLKGLRAITTPSSEPSRYHADPAIPTTDNHATYAEEAELDRFAALRTSLSTLPNLSNNKPTTIVSIANHNALITIDEESSRYSDSSSVPPSTTRHNIIANRSAPSPFA